MANALLPDSDQDEALNPGQQAYEARTALRTAEQEASSDSFDDDTNAGEKSPWNSTYGDESGSRSSSTGTSSRASQIRTVVKKARPLLGVGGGAALLGILFVAITAPSLLLVHMKESFFDRFNTYIGSVEARTSRLLHSKVNNSTKGFCSVTVSVRCKFSSLPDRHVEKLKRAGIELKDETKNRVGRTTFTAYVFDGKEIPASQFYREMGQNPKLRSALRQAYNPKFASYSGKAWSKVASKFKLSKKKPQIDTSSGRASTLASLNTIAKEGVDTDSSTRVRAADCEGDCNWTDEDERSTRNAANELDESGKNGQAGREVKKVLRGLSSAPMLGALNVTGVLDSACHVYGAVSTLTYAAKTIRQAQLARYAMVYLTAADSIKAGEADPESIEALMNIFTDSVKDPDNPGKNYVDSGTDAASWEYGTGGGFVGTESSIELANSYSAGGGTVGKLGAMTTAALGMIGGKRNADKTCGVLANPFVQAGSLVAGVALLFVPGANVVKAVAGATASITAMAAISVLPGLLMTTVAGVVMEDAVGAESSTGIASGTGAIAEQIGKGSGAPVMTEEEAVSYESGVMAANIADYAEVARLESSPLDPLNPHSFIGSIVSTIIPIMHASDTNPVTILGNLASTAISIVTPSISANENTFKESLQVCNDLDYTEVNIAADPFCNPIRGIPQKYLNKDPITVVEELGNQLTNDGTPQGEFRVFIEKCIESDDPLGYHDDGSGMKFHIDRAEDCIISDSNANYYLYYMDMSIEEGMSGDGPVGEAVTSDTWSHPLGGSRVWTTYHGLTHTEGGIDFAAAEGTPVLAVGDGTVTAINTTSSPATGCQFGNYGNMVLLEHTDGTASLYAHFVRSPSVSVGETVTSGQVLGYVGNTGYSFGNHLHFETKSSSQCGTSNIVPAYDFMAKRDVDLGTCGSIVNLCRLAGYP